MRRTSFSGAGNTFRTGAYNTSAFRGEGINIPTPLGPILANATYADHLRGKRLYELKNHLGNVTTVVSDRKVPYFNGSSELVYFSPDIASAQDYYPFGSIMPGRSFSSGYRFGFQGQEQDDEIKGVGNSVNYKYRVHDPRLGRFLSIDPLAPDYPWNSPYAFSENRVIDAVELEGRESHLVANLIGENTGYHTVVEVLDDWGVENQTNRSSVLGVAGFYNAGAGFGGSLDMSGMGATQMAFDYWGGLYDAISNDESSQWDIAKAIDPTGTLGIVEIFARASGLDDISDDELAYARGQAIAFTAIYILGGKAAKGKFRNKQTKKTPNNYSEPAKLPTKYHKRTTVETATLRTAFEGGVRQKFLKHLAEQPGAVKKYGKAAVERMRKGKVPNEMVVHHKKPLFRGGDNQFRNLELMKKDFHVENNKALHWYPEGQNPFGLND